MIYLHSGTKPAAFVYIKCHQTFLALSYTAGLLVIGKKKILLKPPVKECTDLGYLKNLQNCGLSNLQKRFLRSCNETVSGIFINKYFQCIAFFRSFRNLFPGKKHSVFLSRIFILSKVNTEVYSLCHNKLLFFSYFDHEFSLLYTLKYHAQFVGPKSGICYIGMDVLLPNKLLPFNLLFSIPHICLHCEHQLTEVNIKNAENRLAQGFSAFSVRLRAI